MKIKLDGHTECELTTSYIGAELAFRRQDQIENGRVLKVSLNGELRYLGQFTAGLNIGPLQRSSSINFASSSLSSPAAAAAGYGSVTDVHQFVAYTA